jgi:hypothetical protein
MAENGESDQRNAKSDEPFKIYEKMREKLEKNFI